MSDPLLDVRDLRVVAHSGSGTATILDGVSFTVGERDIVGMIGESGSGKTTAVRSILGLLGRNVEIVAGTIHFDGAEVYGPHTNALHSIRGRSVGMVFQDASTSLNPLLKIGTQLKEVLKVHGGGADRRATRARMHDVLKRMGFREPDSILGAYPHQLSGGMRQRAAIAIAVVTGPKLILADEPTSALDVSTQAEVIELFRDLTDGSALLFVTHDLALASDFCRRLYVMYAGQVVESGETRTVLDTPRHAYTQAMIAATPTWGPKDDPVALEGVYPE
jgi:ABC-type dipeptide/oligopeptide/nickel transport system ATPase component